MKTEKVAAIAADNDATRNKRLALRAKKMSIEEARDICANLAMRSKELRTVCSNPQRWRTLLLDY